LASFIGGIFFSSVVKIPPIYAGGFFVLGLLVLIFAFFYTGAKNSGGKNKIIFGVCIVVFTLGVWRGAGAFDYDGGLAVKNFGAERKMIFSGRIVEEPDRRFNFAQYVVDNEALGRVLVKTDLYPEFFYGDTVKVSGKVAKPENQSADFDYQNYLAKDRIFLIGKYADVALVDRSAKKDFYGHLLGIKKSFTEIINKILLEPHASFLSALLVGARRTLPEELTDAFNATGTSHIVAISGYNISIISIMLLNFLSHLFVPRRVIFWIIGICLILFTLIAGAGASVVRAAIMGGLLILAKREGRLYSIANAIVLAGAVMLFFNPYLLRYDAGFQLSFLATFGLVYLAPYLEKRFTRLPEFLSIRSNSAATLSAQIMTLPIILFDFGRLSLIAPLANVLILPVVPLTMLFGFLAGAVGWVSLSAASILALPAWFLLSYQIWIVKILSALPFAAISL